jgi:glycosyltransferase involved in cell wall biosynthesis
LIEAMLMGKPIIASRIAVVEESVQHDVSARLFELKSVDDLYAQMKWMLSHPAEAKTLGNAAREQALEKFDLNKISARHEALYKTIIANHYTTGT